MTDHQCPSCGGFCKKSGCERLNTNDPRYTTERTDWEALFHRAIHNAIYWQNRCCDQQEIIELFCADAEAMKD